MDDKTKNIVRDLGFGEFVKGLKKELDSDDPFDEEVSA